MPTNEQIDFIIAINKVLKACDCIAKIDSGGLRGRINFPNNIFFESFKGVLKKYFYEINLDSEKREITFDIKNLLPIPLLSVVFNARDGLMLIDNETKWGLITFSEQRFFEQFRDMLSKYRIEHVENNEEKKINFDISQLLLSLGLYEPDQIQKQLISDFFHETITQIQRLKGSSIFDILAQIELSTDLDELPRYSQILYQKYFSTQKEMQDYIQWAIIALTEAFTTKQEKWHYLDFDAKSFTEKLNKIQEIKQTLESSTITSNDQRFNWYSFLMKCHYEIFRDLLFDLKLNCLVHLHQYESKIDQLILEGLLLANDIESIQKLKINWPELQDSNLLDLEHLQDPFGQMYDHPTSMESDLVLNLKLECSFILMNYIRDHQESPTQLQKTKMKEFEKLIEKIKYSKTPEEILTFVQESIKNGKFTHKNPLSFVFKSYEGDFHQCLQEVERKVQELLANNLNDGHRLFK